MEVWYEKQKARRFAHRSSEFPRRIPASGISIKQETCFFFLVQLLC